MRTPIVTVRLDEFSDEQIKEYLEYKKFFVLKEGVRDEKFINYLEEHGCFYFSKDNEDPSTFAFQKEVIQEIIDDAIQLYGYNKVMERFQKIF